MRAFYKYKPYFLFFLCLVTFTILIIIYFKIHIKKSKKIIAIFGSVSKNLDNDNDNALKKELSFLATHLTNKYDYIIPNSNIGVIGYFLDKLKSNDISKNVETTYVNSFSPENRDTYYEITYFDTIMEFENDLCNRNDISIFLPGGIGTLYELVYTLFVLLEKIQYHQIIILNFQGKYDFIINKIETLYAEGYLRDGMYKLYKQNCAIVNSSNEIIKILNNDEYLE